VSLWTEAATAGRDEKRCNAVLLKMLARTSLAELPATSPCYDNGLQTESVPYRTLTVFLRALQFLQLFTGVMNGRQASGGMAVLPWRPNTANFALERCEWARNQRRLP